jgi:hypothetical protein
VRLHPKHLSVAISSAFVSIVSSAILCEQHVAHGKPAFGCEAPLLHRVSVSIELVNYPRCSPDAFAPLRLGQLQS